VTTTTEATPDVNQSGLPYCVHCNRRVFLHRGGVWKHENGSIECNTSLQSRCAANTREPQMPEVNYEAVAVAMIRAGKDPVLIRPALMMWHDLDDRQKIGVLSTLVAYMWSAMNLLGETEGLSKAGTARMIDAFLEDIALDIAQGKEN
jgi:hypothetical protein